ncbi:phosphatase 2C-like domain-containing protein [Mycena crocata]|nr:phosphatase 2C-like domain-containing protein [Mycena crocata]
MTFESTTHDLHGGIRAYQSVLPTKGEDRTVVFPFQHGSLIAIFDGHCSQELADFAAQTLPNLVADSFDPAAPDIEHVITKIFLDFDQSLISNFTHLLPKGDWADERWDDFENVKKLLGSQDAALFKAGRRALVGTTVLIGIIDKTKENLWLVSLGDSDAVCGRVQEGKLLPVLMSERHNAGNVAEVARVNKAHPGETIFHEALGNRLLGFVSVTRALGDHQLKVKDRRLASKIMSWLRPSYVLDDHFILWEKHGNDTPPYISATPAISRHALQFGDVLIFASDGLRDSMPTVAEEERLKAIVSLVTGQNAEQLAHSRIPSDDEQNPAELLIRNILFGSDAELMAHHLTTRERDDISVVVVDLGWNEASG